MWQFENLKMKYNYKGIFKFSNCHIGLCISFANAHSGLKSNLIKFKEFVSRKAAKKAQRRKGRFFFASLRLLCGFA
jgi:hypothetical protein